MEAYCVKCKTKREIQNPEPTFTKRATAATRGVCPVCGTNMFRMGRTPAHEGLTPPEPEPSPKRKRAAKKSGKLVIVESPAKARTIGRYLGKGYTVKASLGHVRDLLRSQLSVDVENKFTPKYRVPNEKRPIVKELKKDAAKATEVFLATDLDREGEAIAWHLIEAADVDPEVTRRVVFDEITRPAIEAAFQNPRAINMDLVNAQQARRILDRLVGYSLSPLLWSKVRGRLSAGRVQSVAVRLIVEREREIDEFNPEEYWSIKAQLLEQAATNENGFFVAQLRNIGDKRVGLDKDIRLGSEDEVKPILERLEQAEWRVAAVRSGERKRKPPAPFITSTLQQDAARRLNFTARRTMSIAQQLYEGIDVSGRGATGLITYMRTDSVNISHTAQEQARNFIAKTYGKDFLPAEAPKHKTRSKSAQEAHEAVRPTDVTRTPESIKAHLSRPQFRLYQLVWQRFLASQMTAAIYDTLSVDVNAVHTDQVYLFRATGSILRFAGFLAVYQEAPEEDAKPGDDDPGRIPALEKDDPLRLKKLLSEQHYTQPPPRYTEATLVKTLEEHGIGRPSTYAPTLSTIINRGYVTREDKRLFPTDIGILVNDLLVDYFADVLDVGFTARMEDDLDLIAAGEKDWVPVLDTFYHAFAEKVRIAEAEMPNVNTGPEPVGRDCPECEKPLVIRYGRYGKFIGCSGFPDCRHMEPWLEKLGVICPLDGGELVERRTRKGRTFYGCANYPECEWTSWKRPLPHSCPECGELVVTKNRTLAVCTVCETVTPIDDLVPVEGGETEPVPT